LFDKSDRVDFRVVFSAFRDSLPEPPAGDGPFGLSGEGVLEGLVEQAGLNVLESGEVDLTFVYEDPEEFWRAVSSGGPPQAAKDIVGESVLKEAVLDAVVPYMTDTGGIRLGNNAFQYITATSGS
jgi:hypothetical protein